MPTPYEKIFNAATVALNRLHDAAITTGGQDVLVIVPDIKSEDIYGVRTVVDTDEFETQIVADWSAWRFVLSSTDAGEEHADLPVTAFAKVGDAIPVGSIIRIDIEHLNLALEFNSFKVVKNSILSYGKPYGRQLILTPDRGKFY